MIVAVTLDANTAVGSVLEVTWGEMGVAQRRAGHRLCYDGMEACPLRPIVTFGNTT